jgi:hypothetical protein
MQTQAALTKAYTQALYPSNNDPGAPRGQISQPLYAPGQLTSAAKMSEQLPPGVHGGATEVSRGIFGTGSNVLVPQASSTATIVEPPKAPVDPSVAQTSIQLKEVSTGGSTQLLDAGDGRVAGDVVSLSTPEPSPAPSSEPATLSPYLVSAFLAAAASKESQKSAADEWSFKNPWVRYGTIFVFLFLILVYVFKRT